MQDPIGSFRRIRDFFISYLDTAFRIEDPGVAAERRALLRRPGTLCSEPLVEPVLRYEPESTGDGPLGFTDMRQGLDGGSPDEWNAFVDLVLAGLFPSAGDDAFDRQPEFPPYAHQVRMLRRGSGPGVLSGLDLPVVSHEIPPVDLPGHAAAACPNRDGYGRPPRLSYSG
jgi:hypothetical protein